MSLGDGGHPLLPEDLGSDDVVLLGWPVSHSLSPAMHAAAAEHLGLPLRYRALAVPPEDLSDVIGALGRRGIMGANVTVPHKIRAVEECGALTTEARLVGAVNTLRWERGDTSEILEGHNTDATGLAQALRHQIADLHDARVVLIGTGGAARAAAVALTRCGARVTVVGRRRQACVEILELVSATDEIGGAPLGIVDLADDSALKSTIDDALLVMNATSLGLQGEHLPKPCEELSPHQIAYDLVYGRATPFLEAARRRNVRGHDGLMMLVHQAVEAFAFWTGERPPVTVMVSAATG